MVRDVLRDFSGAVQGFPSERGTAVLGERLAFVDDRETPGDCPLIGATSDIRKSADVVAQPTTAVRPISKAALAAQAAFLAGTRSHASYPLNRFLIDTMATPDTAKAAHVFAAAAQTWKFHPFTLRM